MSNIVYTIGLCLLVIDVVLTDCADGWTRFGESCYLFGHDDLTFQDAQRFCKHFHSNLVNIETSAENEDLRGYLSNLKDRNHWIGLTDQLIDGLWKHYPSDITAKFLDWQSGQPNQGKGANCAAIWGSHSYHWVDEPCTSRYKALCEKPANYDAGQIVG